MSKLLLNIRRNAYSPLVIILGAFLILSLIYCWATPPLEASDELWHFGMINYIADTGKLPVQHPGVKTAYEQEGSQPPLYYLVSALLIKGIDRSDFDAVRQPNPHAVAGIPGNVGNKNLVLHDTPHPPLQRTVLAVYVARLFSVLCGSVTVFSIYMAAREVGFGQPVLPVLAAALTAFNPMFLFITASVNNDNLVTALNSLIIWQMIMLLQKSTFSIRRSVLIAVLLALASLSKLSGLVLLPFALLGGLWIFSRPYVEAWTQRQRLVRRLDWRGFLTFVVLIGLVWALVAGWWYLRNITLYGELFGTQTMVAVAGPRAGGFSLQVLLDEFQGFRFAYWALFGAVNIMTYRWFYDVMDVASIAMIVGLVTVVLIGLRVWLRTRSQVEKYSQINIAVIALWLAFIILAGSISVALWTSQTYASQGRLLFPFNAAISILGAAGLIYFGRYWIRPLLPVKLLKQIVARSVYYILPIGLVAFAIVVPFASIAPQYALPQALAQIPDSARSVYARYGDIALVGYEAIDQRYFPGDIVPITVYWQVIQPAPRDYSLYLHATLDDGTVIGKVDSYPGAGRLRTSTWQAGAIYADTYEVVLDKIDSDVSRLRIQVGWWDYTDKTLVEAVDQNNQPLQSVMLDVGGFAPIQPLDVGTDKGLAVFGDAIKLLDYHFDGNKLMLSWSSVAPVSVSDTVFVQAFDANNQLVAQGDAPPLLPTHYWRIGEKFSTQHELVGTSPLVSGQYRVIIGWYDPVGGTRLPTSSPDNAYTLLKPLVVP